MAKALAAARAERPKHADAIRENPKGRVAAATAQISAPKIKKRE